MLEDVNAEREREIGRCILGMPGVETELGCKLNIVVRVDFTEKVKIRKELREVRKKPGSHLERAF